MIARVRILLPFYLFVPKEENLSPLHFDEDEYRIKIYPPCQAAIDPKSLDALSPIPPRSVLELLRPSETQDTTLVQIDGRPAVLANLLQIDFLKHDFDRRHVTYSRPEELESKGDPPIDLGFALANRFLGKLRTISRGVKVRPLSARSTAWRLDYLTDEGNELSPEDNKFRRRLASNFSVAIIAVNSAVWNKVDMLPNDFDPHIWDTLLLDAEALLPEVGVSLIVAFAALETFIAWALDQLATPGEVKPQFWKWINDRGDPFKEPYVNEQYDILLRIFTGKSLKDMPQLWESLQNLKSVRNSFVHEGKAVLGGKQITVEVARLLIGRAIEIIEWVEFLLPEPKRRPKLGTSVNFQMLKPIWGVADPQEDT